MKSGLLLLGSLVLSLLLGEGVVRALYEPQSKEIPGFRLTESPHYQLDPELGWVPRPLVEGSHIGKRGATSTFSTNSLGLRDAEHPLDRVENTRRIVVVGDSFTWGFGVNDGELFPDVLEELLPRTEVVNLGVTAYALPQEVAYFKRLGVRFDPDILIVALTQNDIALLDQGLPPENTEHGQREGSPTPESDSDRGSAFSRLKQTIEGRSALYRLVVDAVNSNRALVKLLVRIGVKDSLAGFDEMDPNISPALKDYPAELSAAWEAMLDDLRELRALTSEKGIRLIVALVPALQTVDARQLEKSLRYSEFETSDLDVDKPYRALVEFAGREGIEIVNPVGAFRDRLESGDELYLQRDMHFNANGHFLFASEIAMYLVRTSH